MDTITISLKQAVINVLEDYIKFMKNDPQTQPKLIIDEKKSDIYWLKFAGNSSDEFMDSWFIWISLITKSGFNKTVQKMVLRVNL